MSYYYLAASLPLFTIGGELPLRVEGLLAQCEGLMPEGDAAELQRLLEGRAAEGSSKFAQDWHAAETQLRNATARIRASRLGLDEERGQREHRGFSASLESSVLDAFDLDDPRSRELKLDHVRSEILNDLARGKEFSKNGIFAYALRLQLAQRWADLDEAAGRARLNDTTTRNLTAAADTPGVTATSQETS